MVWRLFGGVKPATANMVKLVATVRPQRDPVVVVLDMFMAE